MQARREGGGRARRLLGRKVEFLFEDTQGNPANCVRKAQEMVERHKVNLLTGIMASSEALAVIGRSSPNGTPFFLSSINGAGELTAEKFVPNFFRANTSGPMGARTIALYLKDAPAKTFFAIGLDYAWGHSSVSVFEKEIQRAGKEFVGQGLRADGHEGLLDLHQPHPAGEPDGLYVAMTGDDATAFYQQAAQFKLGEKVQMVTELVDMLNLKPDGRRHARPRRLEPLQLHRTTSPRTAPSCRGSRRSSRSRRTPGTASSTRRCRSSSAPSRRPRAPRRPRLVKAMEGLEVTSVKGKVVMRECDHQGTAGGPRRARRQAPGLRVLHPRGHQDLPGRRRHSTMPEVVV